VAVRVHEDLSHRRLFFLKLPTRRRHRPWL